MLINLTVDLDSRCILIRTYLGLDQTNQPMRNKILASALFVGLSVASMAQDAPMYGGEKLYETLSKVTEVVVKMPGFEYQYVGEWLNMMKLEDPNTISFSRGRVKHSFDLRRIIFIQDEGRFIKIWLN